MSQKIGIGVIGIGFGQHVHVPAFRSDPRCEVRAICATTVDRAQEVAKRLNIPGAYGDAHQLIADPGIHAVAIAVPPGLQPAMIQDAARNGKHVFCEKPIGLNLKDTTDAYQAAQAANIAHAVDFIFPEIAAWIEARRVIQSGELGPLRHVAISWFVETRAYQTHLDNWKSRDNEGGGTLRNLGSHSAYYVEWLFGKIARLSARLRENQAHVDAGVDAWMTSIDGLSISLSVHADAFCGSGHRIEAYGERGSMVLRNESADYVNGFELLVGTRDDGRLVQRVAPESSKIDGRLTAAAKIVRRFIDAIEKQTPVAPNLADGVRMQTLLSAMRDSHNHQRWIDV